MSKDSQTEIEKIGSWTQAVSRTWRELVKLGREPSLEEVAKGVAERRGQEVGVVLGVLKGMEVLMSYAQGEIKPQETALEEEQAGLACLCYGRQAAAQAAVRPLVQMRLQRRLDEADQQGLEVRCRGCGQKMESQGRRQRTWLSTVGELTLARGYQWCDRCRHGRAVAQEKVGLPDADATASLEQVCTLMATTVPHEMASAMVKQACLCVACRSAGRSWGWRSAPRGSRAWWRDEGNRWCGRWTKKLKRSRRLKSDGGDGPTGDHRQPRPSRRR
jgi:hypothetical protein